jgi:uncharacterized membrane protein YdbT with pleckstrin-like domain
MSVERQPEAVVARLRPHSRALFWPTVVFVADVAAGVYFFETLGEPWQKNSVLGAGAAIAILLFAIPVLRWLSRNYTITTRRIVLRSGLLSRTRQELLHSRSYDVTVRQSGLQMLFRSGDVLINSGLDHPVVLRDVPSAALVQSALHDLMEESSAVIGMRRQHDQATHEQATDRRATDGRATDETTRWGTR